MALAPHRHVLGNGVTAIVHETRTTPAVSAIVSVGAGAVSDPPGEEGTAVLTARVLDRGVEGLSATELAEALESRGASLSVSAGRHRTALGCTCLADDAERVLGLAARMVSAPTLPDAEIATRRSELLTELREADDDPAAVAVDRMMAELYAGHPYARSVFGQAGSVARLDRARLQAFHASTFSPASTLVVVAGDRRVDEMIGIVERAFGGWTAAARPMPAPPSPPPAGTRRLVPVPMMDKAQTDVAYGLIGIDRHDPDYDAAVILNNALGQFAIGGRLGDSIRETQGMAYYVYSRLEAGVGAGPLVVRAGVAAANVERAVASIDTIVGDIARHGIADQELDESRNYLIGALPRRLETNAGVAAFLADAEIHGAGLEYDRALPARLAAVTADQVRAVARRLLKPDEAVVVVAGPWQGPSPARDEAGA